MFCVPLGSGPIGCYQHSYDPEFPAPESIIRQYRQPKASLRRDSGPKGHPAAPRRFRQRCSGHLFHQRDSGRPAYSKRAHVPGHNGLAPLNLLGLPASLLTIAFAGQRLLHAQFLARLQVKGMSLHFPDYVLLQDLPLEALERVLKRLALLEPYLSQIAPPTLTRIPIRVRAGTFSINWCFVILSDSTCFGIPKLGSRGLLSRIEVHHGRAALARRPTQQRRRRRERRYYSISEGKRRSDYPALLRLRSFGPLQRPALLRCGDDRFLTRRRQLALRFGESVRG